MHVKKSFYSNIIDIVIILMNEIINKKENVIIEHKSG